MSTFAMYQLYRQWGRLKFAKHDLQLAVPQVIGDLIRKKLGKAKAAHRRDDRRIVCIGNQSRMKLDDMGRTVLE